MKPKYMSILPYLSVYLIAFLSGQLLLAKVESAERSPQETLALRTVMKRHSVTMLGAIILYRKEINALLTPDSKTLTI